MIYEDILPHYLAIGVTWERIMDSCPKELEPYDLAHKKKIEEQDFLQHIWWGNYGISALNVVIEHAFSKKTNAEYIKNPIFSNIKEENDYKESQEEVAIFEMKQRIKMLEEKGLPLSPV